MRKRAKNSLHDGRQPQKLVGGDAAGPAFRFVEVAEPDHRHILQPQHGGGQHPAMPGDQFAIVGHHAGHGPAELRHAGRELGHLIGAVDLGIAGIGPQSVERPSLDLARREDQVHGVAFIWGRADKPMRTLADASVRIGIRDVGENESAREGYLPGAFLR